MLTPEGAEKVVEWAEENKIPFGVLIGPHMVFIALVIGFCILMLLAV